MQKKNEKLLFGGTWTYKQHQQQQKKTIGGRANFVIDGSVFEDIYSEELSNCRMGQCMKNASTFYGYRRKI